MQLPLILLFWLSASVENRMGEDAELPRIKYIRESKIVTLSIVEEHDQKLAQELLALLKRLARRRPPLLQALDPSGLDRWPVDPIRVLPLEEAILLGQLGKARRTMPWIP